MQQKITFFPIGNADTTLIRLASGKNIIWDYANMQGEKYCDLPAELNKRITSDYYDVGCFTHGDLDHTKGAGTYFYFRHATKYQSGSRKKINDLWIPAALLLENRSDLCEDANIIKAEAKYRFLIEKKDVKVFSKPAALKDWVESQGVKFADVAQLVVDAGKCVPGWEDKHKHGVEFFVHSPFKGHVDDVTVIDRNCAAIVVQAVFNNSRETKLLLGSDINSDVWKDIVKVTRYHKVNIDRLNWDILHTSHHCSYKSINEQEKGDRKTKPISETKWLYEEKSTEGCKIIIPSDPIPAVYDNENSEPVHRQAYNYYKEDVSDKKKGEVVVTMEFPSKSNPEPLEITIGDNGAEIVKSNPSAAVYVKRDQSPRVG